VHSSSTTVRQSDRGGIKTSEDHFRWYFIHISKMCLIEKAVTGRCKTSDRLVGLRNSPMTELQAPTQLKKWVYKQEYFSQSSKELQLLRGKRKGIMAHMLNRHYCSMGHGYAEHRLLHLREAAGDDWKGKVGTCSTDAFNSANRCSIIVKRPPLPVLTNVYTLCWPEFYHVDMVSRVPPEASETDLPGSSSGSATPRAEQTQRPASAVRRFRMVSLCSRWWYLPAGATP